MSRSVNQILTCVFHRIIRVWWDAYVSRSVNRTLTCVLISIKIGEKVWGGSSHTFKNFFLSFLNIFLLIEKHWIQWMFLRFTKTGCREYYVAVPCWPSPVPVSVCTAPSQLATWCIYMLISWEFGDEQGKMVQKVHWRRRVRKTLSTCIGSWCQRAGWLLGYHTAASVDF